MYIYIYIYIYIYFFWAGLCFKLHSTSLAPRVRFLVCEGVLICQCSHFITQVILPSTQVNPDFLWHTV